MRIGIDVGGTFTDVVVLDEDDGAASWYKVLTDPEAPSQGVLDGLHATGARLEDISMLKLGTTLGVNAILTRKGARTGLITTEGFRDVLEIRRTHRKTLFDLDESFPEPLVPRDLRLEVKERIGAAGQVVHPLDEDGLRDAWRTLQSRGVEALAIVFLFSFENPIHERRAREIVIAEGGPDVLFLSSDVLPAYREYERTSTTVAAAYIASVVRSYIRELGELIEKRGLPLGRVSMMTNSGGVLSQKAVIDVPVSTLLSGPVGGVVAAQRLAAQSGWKNVLTLDMGGTSCDVSGIVEGVPDERLDLNIDGLTISYPTFDIETIGAGGGSIAWIDSGGTLRVGPQSAGSQPGPACYGRGGLEPTVTDANLVLGRYEARALLGGSIRLDLERAREAIVTNIATPLGLSVDEAAAGILRIVNTYMMNTVRVISVERGRDARDFTLVAFGGSGPVHAAEIARELALPRVLVPPLPGCTSAFGAAISESRRDFLRTVGRRVDQTELSALAELVTDFHDRARATLREENYLPDQIVVETWLELRYEGQAHELSVQLANNEVTVESLDATVLDFHQLHEQLYGHAFSDVPVELVHVRVKGFGRPPELTVWWNWGQTPVVDGKLDTTRQVYFQEAEGFLEAQVHLREELEPEQAVEGPAVIHQIDSTILVPPAFVAEPLPTGSLILHATTANDSAAFENSGRTITEAKS